MRGSGVRWRRRRRCLGTKRVSRRSRLTFRFHDATNVRSKEKRGERERERQSKKYQAILISNDKNRKVRMHENV